MNIYTIKEYLRFNHNSLYLSLLDLGVIKSN